MFCHESLCAVCLHQGKHRGLMCWQVFYLCGVIQFEWGLLCYSPEMGPHLLLVTLVV